MNLLEKKYKSFQNTMHYVNYYCRRNDFNTIAISDAADAFHRQVSVESDDGDRGGDEIVRRHNFNDIRAYSVRDGDDGGSSSDRERSNDGSDTAAATRRRSASSSRRRR